MNDDALEKTLKQTPPPDANAKKRAINLAMAEFDAVHQASAKQNLETRQGFWSRLRLIGKSKPDEATAMKTFDFKTLILGTSAICVFVTSAVILRSPETPTIVQMPDPEVFVGAELSEADAAPKQKPDDQALTQALVSKEVKNALRDDDGNTTDRVSPTVAEAEQALVRSSITDSKRQGMSEETMAAASMPTARMKVSPQVAGINAGRIAPVPVPESRDRFTHVTQNAVKSVSDEPVSTFSVDVDTASYSYVRRQLNHGVMPVQDAVRVEEFINYFDYDYPLPESQSEPFKPTVVVTTSPWKPGNRLVQIGIKGYDVAPSKQPDSHLVFLLDVSGSMGSKDKLPLVKQSMGLLLETLKPTDTVAIVVYAGAAGVVLEPTEVKEKAQIMGALERLNAGGSTAGGAGIELAYSMAKAHFDPKAVNRIILATDGDFNVGVSSDQALKELVERKRQEGIYLSILGFGQGNYQDALMQTLAQNGNGIAAYIDTLSEAQKVLVNEATSSLFPIANDVKIQVEFNPATVSEYRLIGYETRALAKEDFNNDKVDAGDIGAGHTVTALYEITPVGADSGLVDESRYQPKKVLDTKANEYGFLKLRYKLPGQAQSKLVTQPIQMGVRQLPKQKLLEGLDADIAFATAVAGFGQLLKGGQYMETWTYDDVIALANRAKGFDDYGYRTEFVQLVRKAKLSNAQ